MHRIALRIWHKPYLPTLVLSPFLLIMPPILPLPTPCPQVTYWVQQVWQGPMTELWCSNSTHRMAANGTLYMLSAAILAAEVTSTVLMLPAWQPNPA